MKDWKIGEFPQRWVKAWNSRKIDELVSLFTEDVDCSTPLLNIEGGTIHGKMAVSHFWGNLFKKYPDFKLTELASWVGVGTICIHWFFDTGQNMSKEGIDTFYFEETGKVNRVMTHYKLEMD